MAPGSFPARDGRGPGPGPGLKGGGQPSLRFASLRGLGLGVLGAFAALRAANLSRSQGLGRRHVRGDPSAPRLSFGFLSGQIAEYDGMPWFQRALFDTSAFQAEPCTSEVKLCLTLQRLAQAHADWLKEWRQDGCIHAKPKTQTSSFSHAVN